MRSEVLSLKERFGLTLLVALAFEASGTRGLAGWPAPDALASLVGLAFVLIVVPSFCLQLGVARTSPLAVNVMRALAPVCVFAVQQVDDRLHFSGPSLACIAAFSGFAMLSAVQRACAETRRASQSG